MLKNNILILVTALLILFIAGPALAKFYGLDETAQKIGGYDTSASGEETVLGMVSMTISVVLSLFGIVFLVVIIYAGLRWMTARGKDEHIEKAKHAMEAGILGFIITIVSYGLARFIIELIK